MRQIFGFFYLVMALAACAPEASAPSVPPSNEAAETPSSSFPLMISAESGGGMTLPQASEYCRTLQAPCAVDLSGEACGESQSGWSVPSAEQLSLFIGSSGSAANLWTRTPYEAVRGAYIFMSIQDGGWGYDYHYSPFIHVRCVR